MYLTMNGLASVIKDTHMDNGRVPSHYNPATGGMNIVMDKIPKGEYRFQNSRRVNFLYLMPHKAQKRQIMLVNKSSNLSLFDGVIKAPHIPTTKMKRIY